MLNLTAFQSFIQLHELFKPEDLVLLAISGGRDSVLMAHYFKQSGFRFGIAHCNFDLRGTESDAEERFAERLAAEMDVPFFLRNFDTRAYASEHGISIQMAARDLRYEWLEEIRLDFGYKYIALAHHQNDAIETVLLNLVRGTGIAGLHGILPKRDKLIRPLLFLSREEIDESIKTESFSYCDDSSNNLSKYARNNIRLNVIPVLKQLNPQLENTFKENIRRFAELEIVLEQKLDELRQELFHELSDGGWSIPIKKIEQLHPANTFLFGLFNPYGFTEAVLSDLQKSFRNGPGKMFESASHQLFIDRNLLYLKPKNKEAVSETFLHDSDPYLSWNNDHYKSYLLPASAFRNKINKNFVQLDYGLLRFPLKMRSWQEGDFFYPLGMKGRKKLSDYFIEQRIPLYRKKKIGILENGNGEILWIAGYRLDERYKITPATEKIFILEKLIPDGQ